VQRLVLLAQLAGSVRYFYPSQATNRADWQAFYADAIPRLLQAPAAAFGDSLQRIVAAVAPGVVLHAPTAGPLASTWPATGPLYRWEHHSLDLDKQGLGLAPVLMRLAHLPFASRLVPVTPAMAPLPATYTLPLGDSLVATIPLVLPAARVPIAFRKRVRRFRVTQPAQRLALVMQTWSVLQQFYPYRDRLAQVGWLAALPAALRAAAAAQTDQALLVAGQELVARLGDRHVQLSRQTRTGLYITPPDFALAFELLPDSGRPVVARAAGKWATIFPVGSTLEQVNGQPIEEVIDSLQRQTSAATSSAARQLAVHQLLRYFWQQSPAVQLTVRTEAGVQRQAVAFRQLRLPPSRAGAMRALPDSLVYLDAARLQYADFVRQLPALQRARGLIVDLRQRPAYGMQLALAHWATTRLQGDWLATPVLHAPNFAAATYDSVRNTAAARLPHLGPPTVFLIGPGTFSYGETLVELIRHYRLGVLLGQPTGGTNGEMNFVNIGRHYCLSWTGRRVCNRDGQPYQGQGIAPDVVARPTLATVRQQQDAALQQAIAYLAVSPKRSEPLLKPNATTTE
jgi:hypothetical protein